MNEVCLSAKEVALIKEALQTEYASDREAADKLVRKIDILFQEPGDEGGYIGVEVQDGPHQ